MKRVFLSAMLFPVFAFASVPDPTSYASHDFTCLPPSPEVAALRKYVDFPVSYFSGQPNIDLPIYTVTEGSLSVPISVNYHGGGIKVMEQSGIVGLGWTLMASANISRSVNGLPDEVYAHNGAMTGLFHLSADHKYLRNYIKTKPGEYNFFDSFIGYSKEISKYCQPYEEGRLDMANDVLAISGLGLSGTFIYNDNFQMVLQTASNIRFDTGNTLAGNYPAAYQVTDARGTKYYFDEREETKYKYVYYLDRESDPVSRTSEINYTSAWHLTKLESLQGDEISFEYEAVGRRRYKVGVSNSYEMCFNNRWIAQYMQGMKTSATEIDYYPKLLRRVTTKSEIVEFEYDSIHPSDNYYLDIYDRLHRIVVKRNDTQKTIVKIYEFTQSDGPFSSLRGKQLSKIEELSPDGTKRNLLYQLEYVDGVVAHDFKYGQDHWGYYNGAINPTLLPDEKEYPLEDFRTANRDINRSATQIGVLKRIVYPTGGSTTFDWEQHDYGYVNSQKLDATINYDTIRHETQLWGLAKREILSRTVTVSDRTELNIDVSTYVQPLAGKGYLSPEANDGWREYNYQYHDSNPLLFADYPQVVIYDSKNTVVGRVFIDAKNSLHPQIRTVDKGTYTIKLENPRAIDCDDLKQELEQSDGNEGFGYVDITYNEIKENPNKMHYWGGLRIAKITSAGDDMQSAIVKRYLYRTAYGGTATSSGVVPFEPEYPYHYGYGGHVEGILGEGGQDEGGLGDDFEIVYGISSGGLPSTAMGTAGIEYSRVYEILETDSGNVVVEYNYNTYRDVRDVLDMPFSNCGPAGARIYTSKSYKRGDLISKRYFNEEDKWYEKTVSYDYLMKEGSPSEFTGDLVKICDFQHLMYQGAPLIADYTVSTYTLTPYAKSLSSQTTVEKSNKGFQSERTEGYTYFSTDYSGSLRNKFVRSQYSYDSQGRRRETFYTYYQGNYELPETEVTVVGNTIVASRLNVYDDCGRVVRTYKGPAGVSASSIYNLGGENAYEANDALKSMIDIPEYEYQYNDDGNIVQISYNGEILASYLWGYKGKYPIVEALNMGYDLLASKASALGFAPASLASCESNDTLESFFSALRQSAAEYDLTTMTYHWLIGVSASTDSAGITTYYDFDEFGRLKSIKDFNRHFIKKFTYNYKLK